MRAEEYPEFDAMGLADLVRRGEVCAAELTEAAIARIEALDGRLNVMAERGYEQARAAAARIPGDAPLAGVPFLAKDINIEVAGLHLTSSCRWLATLPGAERDAPLARRWRSAGLCILGRTNTPEFAGEFVTEPTWRGPTRNPWDPSRSPGGSSGGAAAAVAAGLVPIAHGTDSGGSIRVPAAACGLVGLKPSRGWIPVGPHFDELAGGLDVEHALTRSVRDTALLLELTAGSDSTTRAPLPPFTRCSDTLDAPLPRLRIGLVLATARGAYPHAEIGDAVELAARALARAGHSVRPFEFPASSDIGEPAGILWLSAIAEEIDHHRGLIGREPRPGELEALTRAAIDLGRRCNAVDYVRARRALTKATRELCEACRDFDLLVLPSTADLPPAIGRIDGRTEAFEFARWNAESYGYAPYTEIFNVTGQPAISLPLAQSASGLPMGVQFAAPLGEDARLLRIARWFEREQPWEPRLRALRRRLAADLHV